MQHSPVGGTWGELDMMVNILTFLAYFAIPLALVTLIHKRKDIIYASLFWWFGAFITVCGVTHLFHALKVSPQLQTIAHAVTAMVSVSAAIVLIRALPALLNLPSFTLLARNLDDSKRRGQELERQVQHFQKMEAIGRLAGGVAHDFGNVLMAIRGYVDLLLKNQLDPVVRADLEEVGKAVQRATDITRQLLVISRSDHVGLHNIDINELLRNLQPMLQRLLGEDVEFHCEYRSDIPVVRGDRTHVEQLILNLVVNARDALPNNRGAITVKVDMATTAPQMALRADRYAVLSVCDTGHGMGRDVLPHIFEPFFTTKVAGKGTGLGLSTVYGVVRQTGGAITVDSKRDHGSTFTVYFPESEIEDVPDAEISMAATKRGGREMILLVEDEAQVRAVIRRLLTEQGYKVLTAVNGVEALHTLAEHPGVRAILTDVVMPVMGGHEFANIAREQYPGIPLVFMSGYSGSEQERRGTVVGADHALAKPFDPQQLFDMLAKVLAPR